MRSQIVHIKSILSLCYQRTNQWVADSGSRSLSRDTHSAYVSKSLCNQKNSPTDQQCVHKLSTLLLPYGNGTATSTTSSSTDICSRTSPCYDWAATDQQHQQWVHQLTSAHWCECVMAEWIGKQNGITFNEFTNWHLFTDVAVPWRIGSSTEQHHPQRVYQMTSVHFAGLSLIGNNTTSPSTSLPNDICSFCWAIADRQQNDITLNEFTKWHLFSSLC